MMIKKFKNILTELKTILEEKSLKNKMKIMVHRNYCNK